MLVALLRSWALALFFRHEKQERRIIVYHDETNQSPYAIPMLISQG